MATFSSLSEKSRAVWAKSGEPNGHNLLAHWLDVAAVAETLLEREPSSTVSWVSGILGLPPEHAVRWVAMLVGLHDFGKAIPGFQAKWPQGKRQCMDAGLVFEPDACTVVRHDGATNKLLPGYLDKILGVPFDWLDPLIGAISAHHGHFLATEDLKLYKPKREPSDWAQVRKELLDAYLGVLSPSGRPLECQPPIATVEWLAGLTSVADWIGSNQAWFTLGMRLDDLEAYFMDARRRAAMALTAIQWPRASILLSQDPGPGLLLQRMTGQKDIVPRPLQVEGDALLRNSQGPTLLLVEAPMGEGKTELAYLAFLRLQQRNRHRGLYLALPTQATSNAMFRRTLRFLQEFIHDHTDIQLIHGGATLNDDAHNLRMVSTQRLTGIADDGKESLSASEWFAQRRRPLLSPYGVGTVDQALLAVLNVKHHFVRLWGLANRIIVLDEIHAYDTYTTGLIEVLVGWLRSLGCSVVLMSATLPAGKRNGLLRAWGGPCDEDVPTDMYPRIAIADDSGVRSMHVQSTRESVVSLAGMAESLEAIEHQVVDMLAAGGCGVVIVNTVDRAQKLYQALQSHLDTDFPLMLFHSRFPADERQVIENQVLGHFGPNGTRPPKALLIASQVVEQSLDVDFDFMISDLAPADLLFQRLGRLHRHERPRPSAHARPCLRVAGLLPDRRPEINGTNWKYVYDPYVLLRTWQLLKGESQLHLPIDIDRWVQETYDPNVDVPADLRGEYCEHQGKIRAEAQLAYNIALQSGTDAAVAYSGRFNVSDGEHGVMNQTRLGEQSVVLLPVHVVDGGISIGAGQPAFQPDQNLSEELARKLYRRQVRVSLRILKKVGMPLDSCEALQGHPWLQDFHFLALLEGRYVGPGGTICLDPKLGLVVDVGETQTSLQGQGTL